MDDFDAAMCFYAYFSWKYGLLITRRNKVNNLVKAILLPNTNSYSIERLDY